MPSNKKGKIVKRESIVKHESLAQYKKGLTDINNTQKEYDKIFEEKLALQYKEFKSTKEHQLQTRKFLRILAILLTIVLVALLLLTFS